MLSFMREDNNKDTGSQSQPVDIDSTAFDGGQDYLKPAEHGKNVKQGTILLAIIFTVGALCMWFMIKKTALKTASAATDEETKIETAIAELTGIRTEINSRMDDIVDKFHRFSEVEQVEVDELSKNPFEYDFFNGSINAGAAGFNVNAEAMKEEARRKSKDLRLLSIMNSPEGGCCMIDDKLLYVGDSINNFEVTKISDGFVELVSNGIQVILKMGE